MNNDPILDDDDPPQQGGLGYDQVADKIGGVPNIRAKDNLIQGVAVLVTTIIGMVIGFAMRSPKAGFDAGPAMLVGALGGLIAGTFISGFVLMILGLIRD